ncbi:acetyl-CoA carboxylase biotin carboxylase subunit [Variovorax sp. KK3]|uniref:acetyl-CoA carboxylase biotin carboxylase subunit n=1 Tax=Variovorax sp. KK3 TaxID=1855728 RepID=UPI00097C811C|nr:acetyl-CoA carboxylase biotin carboxylase subunit [Variovorax sp. KK3]
MTAAATPFRKILIANRGEIALRVMRSARALGYRTVAVYSTADAGAPHVAQADQACCIGEPLPAQSYLNIAALIDAARRSGADAVHPGYGFLAENAAFARACREAGLVFIGPSPKAIEAMGDKAGAKRRMEAAGLPCIPGYQGEEQDPQRLSAEATRIGFPLMIKASAGGGGRGMRRVDAADDFMALLQSAKSEARGAFGDDTVILERAIANPRHVEIQVFADRHGNAIHLGERDCSVQRRHQKLIEEAPCPALTPALRERMGAAAVAAVRAIGYEGTGTLEFLLDDAGQFHFMEMNTRLQVEHPVTEAITGLDLVALQLRVAAGEPLPIRQEDVRADGHAIELRLCAEDARAGFMPQSGVLACWQPPQGLRVEHALHPGAAVLPWYDSMIAKLIAHGRTREEACRRLAHGLDELVALGITTNQAFLARCLAHPVFVAGAATTGFIEAHAAELLAPDEAADRRAAAVAAVLLHETAGGRAARRATGLRHSLPIPLRFDLDGGRHEGRLLSRGRGAFEVELDARRFTLALTGLEGDRARIECEGVTDGGVFHREGSRLLMHYRGRPFTVDDHALAAGTRQADAAGDGKLRAAMNGRVVAVLVAPGERVVAGQPVLTLEAMKMEHVHAAPAAGRVTAVHVTVGEQVAASRVVAEIEPVAAG